MEYFILEEFFDSSPFLWFFMIVTLPWTVDKSQEDVLEVAFHFEHVDFSPMFQCSSQKLEFSRDLNHIGEHGVSSWEHKTFMFKVGELSYFVIPW